MNNRGYRGILAYCDNFLITHRDKQVCLAALKELIKLARRLGFAINYNKVVEPTTRVTFLGVNIDSVQMTVGLTGDKVVALEDKLARAKGKRSLSKKDLQSLAGSLNWALQVIEQGKYFVGRLYQSIKRLTKPWQHTRVDDTLRADLNWWIDHLDYLNHSRPIVRPWYQHPLVIDACTEGGGGFYN